VTQLRGSKYLQEHLEKNGEKVFFEYININFQQALMFKIEEESTGS
jgi:hypothetical protein